MAKQCVMARRNKLLSFLTLMAMASAMGLAFEGCPGGGYVDKYACLSCHNGTVAENKLSFLETPMGFLQCAHCHGAGFEHARSGGRVEIYRPQGEAQVKLCGTCHRGERAGFIESVMADNPYNVLVCFDCHDPHTPPLTVLPYLDDSLCLSCHAAHGFGSVEAITSHTHHPYDPAGTGASRCVGCHMVPDTRLNQDEAVHKHTFEPVPPIASNQPGVEPVPPNSCAGIAGCHDGTVPTAPVFDVDNPAVNTQLETLFESWFGPFEAEGEGE